MGFYRVVRLRFKAEDFDLGPEHKWMSKACAETANALLDAHLATLPVVYGQNQKGAIWTTPPHDSNTHQALLWDVKPIEKKECVHEASPQLEIGGPFHLNETQLIIRCAKCKIAIKASKWEPA